MASSSFSAYAATDVTVRGTLWDYSGQLVSDRKFNVRDPNNKLIAKGKTSADGSFQVSLKEQPREQDISLTFRLAHPKVPIEGTTELDHRLARDLSFMNEKSLQVQETKRTFKFQTTDEDVGDIFIDKCFKTEEVPASYMIDLLAPKVVAEVKGAKNTLINKIDFFHWQSPDAIQKSYGVQSILLTSENTRKLLLNGICPLYFKKEGDFLVAEINWGKYEFDQTGALADVKVYFTSESKTNLLSSIAKISVRFRKVREPSEEYSNKDKYTPTRDYIPGHPDFEEGLRIANSAFFIYGETVFHLGIGHVYGALVADAANEFLSGTKLGELLLPHCEKIQKITFELGRPDIFGPNGILNTAALTTKSVAQLIDDTLASLVDPLTFEPREPMAEDHYFAKAQKLHFGIVKESVEEFFTTNWNEIEKDWKLIYDLSRKLVKKLPDYNPWVRDEGLKQPWQDTNEIGGKVDDSVPQRKKYKESDETVKSFRPFASDPLKPMPHEKEMLKRFVTHCIHIVTIWHSRLHQSQYAENELAPHLMDVNFTPITLSNYGQGPFGGIDTTSALTQAKTAETFKRFKVEHYALVNNPKVYKGLVDRIKAAAHRYLAVGIDVEKELAYGVVI